MKPKRSLQCFRIWSGTIKRPKSAFTVLLRHSKLFMDMSPNTVRNFDWTRGDYKEIIKQRKYKQITILFYSFLTSAPVIGRGWRIIKLITHCPMEKLRRRVPLSEPPYQLQYCKDSQENETRYSRRLTKR